MDLKGSARPTWLTFDCYGTLIQWDEGLLAAVQELLRRGSAATDDVATFISIYDRHEHALEQAIPFRSFREITELSLESAMREIGRTSSQDDADVLTASISAMPPFPEVVETLKTLKQSGFKLCIVSNTDDAIIAGNVDQLGGTIDSVITAEQARAYKPAQKIFDHAHHALGVSRADVVHICASPHLDLAAARDLGFRCIWIDRGTGRKALPDYRPGAVLPSLDRVPPLFHDLGWI